MELNKSQREEFLNYWHQGKFTYLNYRSVVNVRDDSWYVYFFYGLYFAVSVCYSCFSVLLVKLWLSPYFKINVNIDEKSNSESQHFETFYYNIADNSPHILLYNSCVLNLNFLNGHFQNFDTP